jgi:transcriptional regulator with XRE-family HTH domain
MGQKKQSVGEIVRMTREQMGLERADVAAALKLSRTYYAGVERDADVIISVETLERLRVRLGLTEAQLPQVMIDAKNIASRAAAKAYRQKKSAQQVEKKIKRSNAKTAKALAAAGIVLPVSAASEEARLRNVLANERVIAAAAAHPAPQGKDAALATREELSVKYTPEQEAKNAAEDKERADARVAKAVAWSAKMKQAKAVKAARAVAHAAGMPAITEIISPVTDGLTDGERAAVALLPEALQGSVIAALRARRG